MCWPGSTMAPWRPRNSGRAWDESSRGIRPLDDSWSDLAKKPVFLPLVHQLVRYLARYEEPAASRTVGQVLDLTSGSILAGSRRDRVVLTPSGRRVTLSAGSGPEFLELDEQGFYELRSTGAAETRPPAVAVDIDPAESDLSAMDPREFVGRADRPGRAGRRPNVGARPGHAAGAGAPPGDLVVPAVRRHPASGDGNNPLEPDLEGVSFM